MDGRRPLALVTGASSGIGLELARVFAANGFDLVVVADLGIEDAATSLSVHGGIVEPILADLATYDGVRLVYDTIERGSRPIDVLVLNAGIGSGGRFVETPLGEDLRLIALNVTSVVHLAKLLLPAMVARGEGKVLMTASLASTAPGPYFATYAASKAFVLSFAEAVRAELSGTGVSVTALVPGPTDTNFFRRAAMQNTRIGRSHLKDRPEDVAADGFRGLMEGRRKVVAGSRWNDVTVLANRLLPDSVSARLQAVLSGPPARRRPVTSNDAGAAIEAGGDDVSPPAVPEPELVEGPNSR